MSKKNNNIKIFISSILIVLAFFLWYLFSENKTKSKIEQLENKESYVSIERKGKNVNITNINENIILLLDWKEVESGEITLE